MLKLQLWHFLICTLVLKTLTILTINPDNAKSVYDFSATDILGNEVSLEQYKDRLLIIVNVASNCGLSDKNYDELNQLYEKYEKSKGLSILAFPCNQFAEQDTGTNEQILDFVKNKGVKFDMFAKIDVNGEYAHPLWTYLKQKKGSILGNSIKWDFTKFVVDKNGQVVERFAPTTGPNEMVSYLKKYW